MDINQTLEDIRLIVSKIQKGYGSNHDAGDLSDLWDALDNWLSNKGFLPEDWKR